MNLFSNTITSLERSLDYAAKKNQVISNNIANIDTPNYKAKDVLFKDMLHAAMDDKMQAKKTSEKHLDFDNNGQAYEVVTNNHTMFNHNGNNVDVDKEMAELAKNQIYYQSLIERLNGNFKNIETVIRGGR
ncbi:flagellar basal body rod protein FlgB [Virgibacillus soli]|uniref:Flagellar basal body rod protein FlgB n=1 Tax=Paracerasibacillus soli TaxID=480284 RepID=A0ABU5CP63_9BACI|nr:flagellar basal body rod protein FlgB [Virgibacillus soli]MDY0408154.1 flagellar basal body rod protein FlgB [Virgibacillus soli]